jgi:hypothetical protein
MEPGAMQQLQGQGSVELHILLPILPMVSCFSICGFREGFASCWLWDHMCAFWGPLIFLFHGGWTPLEYRGVNNPPSCLGYQSKFFITKNIALIPGFRFDLHF